MSTKTLNIISSGQLRVEKISLNFLSTIIKPLESFDINVNWYGTFWNDELINESNFELIKLAGCNIELIEPLSDQLITE